MTAGLVSEGQRRAARALVRLVEGLAHRGTTLMALATGGGRTPAFRPYPRPPIYDARTRSLLAYHRHVDDEPWLREAGHFHAVRILRLRPREERASLVAISMSRGGWPRALFTVNLWSWRDRSQRAAQLRAHVRHFRLRVGGRCRRLARFANLVLQAYGPEIERLQEEKLQELARLRRRRPGAKVTADRSIDLLSSLAIDVRARAAGRIEPGGPAPLVAPRRVARRRADRRAVRRARKPGA
jgi:hypothetical protein